jgi:glycosyltransferase involved in cell wall biosynthesis
MAAKSLDIKILYTFHDVEPFEDYSGGQELLKAFYLLADGATVGGEAEKDKLVEKYGFSGKPLEIAKHGVYTIFDFQKYDQKTARTHLGIPLNKKVILNFGIYRPYKGYDDMVRAMPKILTYNPEAFLYISAGVRVYKDTTPLLNLVKDLKLSKNVKICFDFVPSEEIEPIFKASDLVVLPYRQVSQSGIFNVAVGFKKPIVLSELFLEAEQVENNLGLVVPPASPESIAGAVSKIMDDQKLYDKFQEGATRYQESNDWQKTGSAYLKVLAEIL